jgi:hypothetical protein
MSTQACVATCIDETFDNCGLRTSNWKPCKQPQQRSAGKSAKGGTRAALSFALATELFKQLDLDLLNLEQPIVLAAQQMIDFLVQVPDFELGF